MTASLSGQRASDPSKQAASNQASNRAGSNQAASSQSASKLAATNRADSNQVASNRADSNQATSNQAASNQAASNRADSNETGSAAPAPRVRLADRVREMVDARLMLMPGPVAAALALCAAARTEAATKVDGPAMRAATEAMRDLTASVTEDVLRAVSLEDEAVESRRFASTFLLAFDRSPELEARGQGALDRLERATPHAMHCHARVMSGGGSMAFGKGGENVYLTSDFFQFPEDEVAATLAHERVHLLERHLQRASVVRYVGEALEQQVADEEKPPLARATALAHAALQREQEFEADAHGAAMLDAAGYGRDAMVRLLQRLVPHDLPVTPLDDHPPASARIAALQK